MRDSLAHFLPEPRLGTLSPIRIPLAVDVTRVMDVYNLDARALGLQTCTCPWKDGWAYPGNSLVGPSSFLATMPSNILWDFAQILIFPYVKENEVLDILNDNEPF